MMPSRLSRSDCPRSHGTGLALFGVPRSARVLVQSALYAVLSISLRADGMEGKILDPSGKPVAGAEISLFDKTSGAVHTTVSASDGAYSFSNLVTGTYLVEAESAESALA